MIKKSRKKQWSEGVWLLGRYEWFGTGAWMLVNGHDAALVEMPPYNPNHQESPARKAYFVAKKHRLNLRYILCTHNHSDHCSIITALELARYFPEAEYVLQQGFEEIIHMVPRVHFFNEEQVLYLEGEPLYIVHAPKHSWTDTMVIFKGVAITGDWELNTLHSCHDDKPRHRVSKEVKIQSIQKMRRFQESKGYHIHKVFSVHANDRRENVNFNWLMDDTLVERRL